MKMAAKSKLTFLGAAGEVGRSSILLSGTDEIMLDCGLKIHTDTPYPVESPAQPDFVVLSHAHLDHTGFTPALYRHHTPEMICTPATAAMAEIIIDDSMRLMEKRGEFPYRPAQIKQLHQNTTLLSYKKWYEIGESTVTLHQAGHIPGASFVEVETGDKRVVYTGDFKGEETKTTFASEPPPANPDALIIESTYSDRDHPPRKDLEMQMKALVGETLGQGGTVLLPAFAIGRTQELIRIVRSFNRDCDIWLDGMGARVSETLSHHSHYVKDFKRFKNDLETCKTIHHPSERGKVLKRPGVIIATAGMLQGGPALGYLLKMTPESRAIFTGYCVEDTNGHNLINKGYVEYDGVKIKPKAPWSYLDFSAHAGRTELFELVETLKPKKVFCIHGDACQKFADELALEGFDATAPALGDTVEI
jgi:putative mRNA 3-end processing factor